MSNGNGVTATLSEAVETVVRTARPHHLCQYLYDLAGQLSTFYSEVPVLKAEPRKFDVLALREPRVAYMNRATFQWLHDNSIHFNRFLLIQLNERLGQFIGMMEHERLLDTDSRLARCLASLYNPVLYPESNLEIRISQEEIGLLAGISRQRVNQALRKLEDAGLLQIDYGSITILDLPGLRSFGE